MEGASGDPKVKPCVNVIRDSCTFLWIDSLFTWAQLFKTNDVVSKRFVKISNISISNMAIFFVEKM